ncbi:uncharacterized protein LACBIDRAFT_248682 [Laccaria bicolor S238N-H82]|uniref:Predicted protein n=1 Tax=Laccaria bicolor (strain S238N-H82 / ATCC MYA-4686) TaxID=486041 RepID=B0D6A0_LACBS|nr:uncharacterized protein LACBIDRAFT_248682 [Laccaria bicolor S238N-H82]EDR09909.1 predicted protein [Laccaria bicolor S238N-H82]|eukprot:XP_001879294.1 predicted protein [Laccaria bicolor S238N-H82]
MLLPGDIIYFEVVGQPFLVLGSLQRVNDILDKKSSNYSDRLSMPMLRLMGWGYDIPNMPYGTMWRRHRRAFHEHFHANAVHKYLPTQAKESQALLFLESNDPYITLAEEALRGVAEAGIPGTFLVDLLPFLKYVPGWFPGADFKRKAAHYAAINAEVVNQPLKIVQKKVAEGTAIPCVLTSLLEEFPGNEELGQVEKELISRNTAAIAYIAGADTTVSTTQTFFLAMAMYPEALRKAQAEIDAVVGANRLPDFNDRPYLPYVNAIIKETMRWKLVLPLGFAHMSTEDDEYDGYFIPKGTVVIGAAWSILHDPEVFEAPEEFWPERYLKDGQIDPSVRDPVVAAFGFGRRMCPGRYLSDNSLYSIVSSVLAVYNINAPLDGSGKPEQIDVNYTSGLLSYPLPFNCTIKPRSEAAESLIRGLSDSLI